MPSHLCSLIILSGTTTLLYNIQRPKSHIFIALIMAAAKQTTCYLTRLLWPYRTAGSCPNSLQLYNHFPLQCQRCINTTSGEENKGTSSASDWRKKQLENLEKKFTEPAVKIESEEDLQPMWSSMEKRVKNRRPRTLNETGGKTGRTNIKTTDEELWLQEGLYDEESKKEQFGCPCLQFDNNVRTLSSCLLYTSDAADE